MTSVDIAPEPTPQWVAPTWQHRPGRDPLGFQAITRALLPDLVPSVIEGANEARYFSLYAFLLDEYQKRRRPDRSADQELWFRQGEWDYGLAVRLCGACESVPIGNQAIAPVINHHDDHLPRGTSVESSYGGYGLYYQAVMDQLGLVVRRPQLSDGTRMNVHVLSDVERAQRLADTFRAALQGTRYYRDELYLTTGVLPRDVLVEYAEAACLCRLSEHEEERAAIHQALLGLDEHAPPEVVEATVQRQRSLAHFLVLLDDDPSVPAGEDSFRHQLSEPPAALSPTHALIAGQWAALVAKDVLQEAVCSIWSRFLVSGLDAYRRGAGAGLTMAQVEALVRALVAGPPTLDATEPASATRERLARGEITADVDGTPLPLSEATLEQLRDLNERTDSATLGLLTALELVQRVRGRDDAGWMLAATVESDWQPSLRRFLSELQAHTAAGATVADTLWWLVRRHIIDVHQRNGYLKLSDRGLYTFRFRWENDTLRFYEQGIGRFPLASIRHKPFSQLTRALGLWERIDEGGQLTAAGRAFVAEHLGS